LRRKSLWLSLRPTTAPDRHSSTFAPASGPREKTVVAVETAYIAPVTSEDYERFMRLAFREAEAAFERGEVPVGAVVVHGNRIIGRGHNLTESMHDATAHAEIIALSAAYKHFGDWRLQECHLFSTLEPCTMCAGAAVLSRIDTIVFGARDPKFGGCGSIFSIPTDPRLNHCVEVVGGVMEPEIADLMRLFFRQVRDGKGNIN
jgi:tRNA(adenine34) deaminase